MAISVSICYVKIITGLNAFPPLAMWVLSCPGLSPGRAMAPGGVPVGCSQRRVRGHLSSSPRSGCGRGLACSRVLGPCCLKAAGFL